MMAENNSYMDFLPATISSILFALQIIIGILLLPSIDQNPYLAYMGVGLYVCSGWFFGMFPILEFRKHGGVKKGKSYVHTTKIVRTGIYSIIRHPQYVTWMLFAIAGMLLFQHYIIIIIGLPIFLLTYIDLLRADNRLIKKFGEDYKTYMNQVPRANVILGIYRVIKKKKKISKGI